MGFTINPQKKSLREVGDIFSFFPRYTMEAVATPMLTEDEKQLVEEAKTNDAAFSRLYDRYYTKIYAYIYRRVGDKDTTEDILSATFEKVFLHLEGFDGSVGTFQAWIYRIATNQVIDHVRKMKRVLVVAPDDFPEPIPLDSEIDRLARGEEGRQVRRVLEKIPERYQRVLLLKFFSELTNQEIADTLGVSVGHAGVLLYRALKRFKNTYSV